MKNSPSKHLMNPIGSLNRRHGCFFCFLSGLLLLIAVGLPHQSAQAATTTQYLFTVFTNSSESNMYLYQAADALNFSLVKGPAYTPPGGLVRDPSLMKHTDGYYYIAYTTNWTGTNFGIARSWDLINWSFVTNVNVNVSGTQNTWAPEWFIDSDGSVNLIVSLSSSSYANFRSYKFTAQNGSLTSWSGGVALNGIAPNYIDTFIVKEGGIYHAFAKNETTKYIEHAIAANLTGPYYFVGTGDWAGWGNGIEGPALVQLDSGAWRIYFDKYTSPTGYYYSDSPDLTTWSAKAELPGGLSGLARHGTVLKESVNGVNVKRLQSKNFTDRYIRHYNFEALLEADVVPFQDSLWRIVPGLANANGYISLESVNLPGYYLRHHDFILRLDPDDGTDLFKADATFKKVAGLADSSYSSLQSYNHPDRYIRHYNFHLRLDPISTAADKLDATFKVTN
jgi:hypothetical protein